MQHRLDSYRYKNIKKIYDKLKHEVWAIHNSRVLFLGVSHEEDVDVGEVLSLYRILHFKITLSDNNTADEEHPKPANFKSK